MKYAAYSYGSYQPEVHFSFTKTDSLPEDWLADGVPVQAIKMLFMGNNLIHASASALGAKPSGKNVAILPYRDSNRYRATISHNINHVPITRAVPVKYNIINSSTIEFKVDHILPMHDKKPIPRRKANYNMEDLKKACILCKEIADALGIKLHVDNNEFSMSLTGD